jgi:hypothetical protein
VVDTEVEAGLPRSEGGAGACLRTGDGQRSFLVDLRHLMLRAKGQRGVHPTLPACDLGVGLGVEHAAGRVEEPRVDLGRGRGSHGQRLVDAPMGVPQDRGWFAARSGALKIGDRVPDTEHRALVVADVRLPSPLGEVPLSTSSGNRPHRRQLLAVRQFVPGSPYVVMPPRWTFNRSGRAVSATRST